mmetsp:Transcript_4232/g.11516  ORF Transcript_4232/g.11516 Transcript_4232/m.11516 type:complete len:415 (-) Transcript_4232:206-1450(-)|eukprot:CAMPEP_0168749354 /NCGR_PEP_ID=MMETSP0724-20121128/16669_1 /TAXON_ID=265536 /ORGANISM="Amphiprora sp., Strain CCMP467" /LENGTH=414 /DNA_ID=CAMNT_0008797253 /DNA_START=42 /DNA_END=1286 /DNA_ORIENTATION=+
MADYQQQQRRQQMLLRLAVLAAVAILPTRAFAPSISSSSGSATTRTTNLAPIIPSSSQRQQQRTASTSLAVSATAVAVNGDSAVNGDAALPTNGEDDDDNTQIRLNVYEKARTVTSVCTSGTLCTVSAHQGIEGAPFGSFVDYVLDDVGNPVLLMNEMSMHTINVQKAVQEQSAGSSSALVTLFTQLGGNSNAASSSSGTGAAGSSSSAKSLQDVSRCSLTGTLEKIDDKAADMDAIRMRYSIAHAYADQVMDSPKFAFYRLVPQKIYFVGGFGVLAKWVEPEDYQLANPDILAKDAPEMVQRINRDHVEDLMLTATQLLNVESEITKIRMTNVDRLGMDIRVTSQLGSRRNKLQTDEYRIGFRIPVISVEDAKSEVLKVFQEAWEKENGFQWDDGEEVGDSVPVMKIAADSLE